MDLPVFDLKFLLTAHRQYIDFQNYDRLLATALAAFLQNNGLVRGTILANGQEPPDDLLIKESDLTDLGIALKRDGAIFRWLDANNDVRKPISMRSLERSLKKALAARQ